MSEPTRCACSFPHPPHDWCDGNPDGETLADVVKRRMSEPTIPPTSEAVDKAMVAFTTQLAKKYQERAHAAESERDRLAERLRRAEELLEPFRTHVGGCSDAMCPNCRIYRYFAESPTEKQA